MATKQLLKDMNVRFIGVPVKGWRIVRLYDGKENFITPQGSLFLTQWKKSIVGNTAMRFFIAQNDNGLYSLLNSFGQDVIYNYVQRKILQEAGVDPDILLGIRTGYRKVTFPDFQGFVEVTLGEGASERMLRIQV